MAPPARLELTTLRLGGVRSIQVSYRGILGYYSGNPGRCQGWWGWKNRKIHPWGRKNRKITLYRTGFIRYNKLICYGYHTLSMEILI